jgi:putative transposase
VARPPNELGMSTPHSRPKVSNGHAFNEAWFKTAKYSAANLEQFANLAAAQQLMTKPWLGTYAATTTEGWPAFLGLRS